MLPDIKGLNVYIPLNISRAQIFLLILRDTYIPGDIEGWHISLIKGSNIPVDIKVSCTRGLLCPTQNLDIKGPNTYISLHKKGSNTPVDI